MADRFGTIWKTTTNPYCPSPLFAIPASRTQVVKLVRSLQLVLIAMSALGGASSGLAKSQAYPGKIIRQSVGFPQSRTVAITARREEQTMTMTLWQNVPTE